MKVLSLVMVFFLMGLGPPGCMFLFVVSSLSLVLYAGCIYWVNRKRLARTITSESMCATPEQERALDEYLSEVGQIASEMIGGTGSGDAG